MKILQENCKLVDYQANRLRGGRNTSTFILTRFNLKLWSKNKMNQNVRTKEWLKKRFLLFESYCLPSIINQTDKEFNWLCFFDINTPSEYLERIEDYQLKCVQFVPFFLDDYETKEHEIKMLDIIRDLKDKTDNLITIRLDNDDALRENFIQQIHSLGINQKQSKSIYSFISGMQYFEKYGIATKITYPDNHFLALIDLEYNKKFTDKTVLSFRHDKINHLPYPFIQLSGFSAMWIEVIHSNNVANDIKKNLCNGLVYDSKSLIDSFHIHINGCKNGVHVLFTFILGLLPHYMIWFGRKLFNRLRL